MLNPLSSPLRAVSSSDTRQRQSDERMVNNVRQHYLAAQTLSSSEPSRRVQEQEMSTRQQGLQGRLYTVGQRNSEILSDDQLKQNKSQAMRTKVSKAYTPPSPDYYQQAVSSSSSQQPRIDFLV